MKPISPDLKKPSGVITLAVSSGRFQYPAMTCGPLMQISPTSPRGRSLPSSSRMAISVEGSGKPIVPVNRMSLTLLAVATGELAEILIVQERVEQRVQAREDVEGLLLQFLDEGRNIARIGDEEIVAALLD